MATFQNSIQFCDERAIAFTSIKPVIAIHTHKKAIASLIFPHED
ncbi:hypothetical protein [Fischerella thermalis]